MYDINGYTYALENGQWVWKAKEPETVNSKGVLKPKYKDLPRYKLIYEIEKDMNVEMANQIISFVEDTKKLLNSFLNG